MISEAGHLREIAHRRLTGVALPVRVRRERRGRVERRVRGDRAKALGIEWQPALQALQRVEGQHRDAAEGDERRRVLRPAHLALRVDAARAIEGSLHRAQHAIEPGAFAREHPRHVAPRRPRHRGDRGEEHGDLQPTVGSHIRSIQKRSGRNSATMRYPSNPIAASNPTKSSVVTCASLDPLTGRDVCGGHDKEREREPDEHDVRHHHVPCSVEAGARNRTLKTR